MSHGDSLDAEAVTKAVQDLIAKYENFKAVNGESALRELTEANVRKDYIDRLFEILGWSVRDSNEYDAEHYIRGAGLADIAMKVAGKIVVYVEAKRFGAVPSRLERGTQVTLLGYKVLADWTVEERQVLNYAGMSLEVKWAILTNFEKFRLFNAHTGDTIINIEKPSEYLDKLDDILLLSHRNVESGAVNKLESKVERKDVDLSFLALMNHWRVVLANDLHKTSPELDMGSIKHIVQRIIDRLVVIRFAEDKWLLDDPDQLRATFEYWKKTRTYTKLSDLLAALNYGYGFLEAECRMAINAVGLEPAVGFLHDFSDYQTKESLVYDLQEPFRWLVDVSVCEAFESGALNLKDFYFTGDDYRYRFKVEAKERFIELLRDHFNAGVMWKSQRFKWDTAIEQKAQELGRFLVGKSGKLDFNQPAPVLERFDGIELRDRIKSLTSEQAKAVGIGKSTLYTLRQHAREERSFRLYGKVSRKLQALTS